MGQEGEEPHPALSCHSSTEALGAPASPKTPAGGTGWQRASSTQALCMVGQAGNVSVAVIE